LSKGRRFSHILLIVLLVYLAYAGLFIYRTSFVVDGERYFTLFDDAMISMRYGKNLAEGHGLVWNRGEERVEGYTNLLWTIYMGALHLLPVAAAKISLLVQMTSALLLAVNLVFVKRVAEAISPGSRFVWLGSVLITAFYLPLNGWSLQGMEVGALALLVTVSAYGAVSSVKTRRFSPWPYFVLAAAMFVRPDMGVTFVALLGFMLVKDRPNRRKHLAYGIGLLLAALTGQTIFRVAYYGEILPNSYYLKVTGFPLLFRLTRGLYVGLVFAWRMNWIFFVVPLVYIWLWRNRLVALLGTLFVAQVAYSIYVGGDAWESWGGSNRYICIAMPCFFVAFFCSVESVGELLRERLLTGTLGLSDRQAERHAKRIRIAFVVLGFVSFNAIYGPAAVTEALLLKPTLHVDDNQRMVERAVLVSRITTPEARVAVVWDGAIPYFSDRHAVSILGKNDKRIARLSMRGASGAKQLVAFYPGHLKWDYAYSIGQLRPDVVVQLWQSPEEATPYLAREYMAIKVGGFTFNLLKGSRNILWDRVWNLTTGS
jgi:hypothetical protein